MPGDLERRHADRATVESVQDLRELLAGGASLEAIAAGLSALQTRGLERSELQVHVERMRAENASGRQDPALERNAQLALDLILGSSLPESLSWDAPRMAAVHAAHVLTEDVVHFSAEFAQRPSDLLPPRPIARVSAELLSELAHRAAATIRAGTAEPTPADFFRVPKDPFTTRPAALLAWNDRLLFESLASVYEDALVERLPKAARWPRGRRWGRFTPINETVATWAAPYVVRADVEAFYESVDHALLAELLDYHFPSTDQDAPRAVRTFLDAIMASGVGLPQGVAASDVFAGVYVAPLDLRLELDRWDWTRVGDDYWFPATSIDDARRRLATLEEWLQTLGLRLNGDKTLVLKAETFRRLERPRKNRIERHLERLRQAAGHAILEGDTNEIIERLRQQGVPEEQLWSVFYHGQTPLPDLIEDLRAQLAPQLVDLYDARLSEIVERVRRRDVPGERRAEMETELRDALSAFSGSDIQIEGDDVAVVLSWFPRLAPAFSGYLRHAEGEYLERVLPPLIDASTSDWISAWLVAAVEERPSVVVGSLADALERVVVHRADKPLSRVAAMRSIARVGTLSGETLARVWEEATPAVRSEIALSVFAEPHHYDVGEGRDVTRRYGALR
ncbi:RNA-directed DNA polymerase [Miltoncostaea marina]|uniref:RNA-directed DNA polymerase n=1 Tax=Miltoncostaea marina TaxID=2843215 RepID=UPI001C3CA50C|nr:RNA-directed DNA polymerase [Miltoncostaea marina]